MKRRKLILLTASAGLTGLSGCLEFVTGSEPLSFRAEPAEVSSRGREETGYLLDFSERRDIARDVSFVGQSRTINVSNYRVAYTRHENEELMGGFGILTTPEASIAGRSLNPINDRSNTEIIRETPTPYQSVRNIEHISDHTRTVLGKSTQVGEFSAEAVDEGGDSVPIRIHLAKVTHNSDIVIAAGVHDAENSDERDTIGRLFGEIQRSEATQTWYGSFWQDGIAPG